MRGCSMPAAGCAVLMPAGAMTRSLVPNDRNRRGLGRVRIGEMVKAAETRVHICEADRPTNGAGLEVGRIVVLGQASVNYFHEDVLL